MQKTYPHLEHAVSASFCETPLEAPGAAFTAFCLHPASVPDPWPEERVWRPRGCSARTAEGPRWYDCYSCCQPPLGWGTPYDYPHVGTLGNRFWESYRFPYRCLQKDYA